MSSIIQCKILVYRKTKCFFTSIRNFFMLNEVSKLLLTLSTNEKKG